MAGEKRKTKRLRGDRERRYHFISNPYDDCGFTRCPRCEEKTKVRMFCLLIHVEPRHLVSLNKSCKFCPSCEIIIVKKAEIEGYLAAICEQRWPECIGNDYLVVGTLDRKLHRKGKAGTVGQKTAIDSVVPFVDHLRVEVRGGWVPRSAEARLP